MRNTNPYEIRFTPQRYLESCFHRTSANGGDNV